MYLFAADIILFRAGPLVRMIIVLIDGGQAVTVEQEVLKRIKPTPEEEQQLHKVVEDLIERTKHLIKERNIVAEPLMVGSVAKGTFLKMPDLDLFILFPTTTPLEKVRNEALALGEALLESPEKRFAQHPYLRGKYKGFDTEVVPCFKVEKAGAKMSAVDRTPFHTKYVMDHIRPGQGDEIRLFKAFLKGIGIYGAEIAIEGFSGYLCEIMVLKFGTFMDVLKAAANFDRKVRLRLDDGKFPPLNSAFVFIDPVDPERNVAAPVSEGSFSILIHASSAYLSAPSEKFFFPRPVEVLKEGAIIKAIRERGTEIVGVEIAVPEVVEDIYASQISKAERALGDLLEKTGFPMVKGKGYIVETPTEGHKGKALVVLETGVKELSASYIHQGPEVGHPNEKDFLDTWKDHPRKAGRPHIKDRRWAVYVKREFRRPIDLVGAKLVSLNLGKHLNLEAKGSFRTLDLETLAKGFPAQMSEFLDDRFPWER
jgi:tRNA nucleotidyltransferase (CCA-adding enzyme)